MTRTMTFTDLPASNGAEQITASITLQQVPMVPGEPSFVVAVHLGDQVFHATGFFGLDALFNVRKKYEPLGWRIGVNGASIHCNGSGMSNDMTDGMKLYRRDAGGAMRLVDTFAPCGLDEIGTLKEQRENWYPG